MNTRLKAGILLLISFSILMLLLCDYIPKTPKESPFALLFTPIILILIIMAIELSNNLLKDHSLNFIKKINNFIYSKNKTHVFLTRIFSKQILESHNVSTCLSGLAFFLTFFSVDVKSIISPATFIIGLSLAIAAFILFYEHNFSDFFKKYSITIKVILSLAIALLIFFAKTRAYTMINSVFNIDPSELPFSVYVITAINIAAMIQPIIFIFMIISSPLIIPIAKDDGVTIFSLFSLMTFNIFNYHIAKYEHPTFNNEILQIALKYDFSDNNKCSNPNIQNNEAVLFLGVNYNKVLYFNSEGKPTIAPCI